MSVEDKKKVKTNLSLAPDTKHCTISHDCLTTAMFGSARTCCVLQRMCMQKINGAHWSTFYKFASYNEAHTHTSTSRHQEREREQFMLWNSRGNTPHDHTESTEWRAEGVYWAQGKLPECNTWQQIIQEASNTC